MKLLVINNDTDFLTLMSEVISHRGWESVVCRESSRAQKLIRDESPDVVIVDVRMESPEAGWNIVELAKLDPATRNIPIIVCSGAADDLAAKAEWLNAHGIVSLLKPFDIDDLYEAVEKISAG